MVPKTTRPVNFLQFRLNSQVIHHEVLNEAHESTYTRSISMSDDFWLIVDWSRIPIKGEHQASNHDARTVCELCYRCLVHMLNSYDPAHSSEEETLFTNLYFCHISNGHVWQEWKPDLENGGHLMCWIINSNGPLQERHTDHNVWWSGRGRYRF